MAVLSISLVSLSNRSAENWVSLKSAARRLSPFMAAMAPNPVPLSVVRTCSTSRPPALPRRTASTSPWYETARARLATSLPVAADAAVGSIWSRWGSAHKDTYDTTRSALGPPTRTPRVRLAAGPRDPMTGECTYAIPRSSAHVANSSASAGATVVMSTHTVPGARSSPPSTTSRTAAGPNRAVKTMLALATASCADAAADAPRATRSPSWPAERFQTATS